MFESASFLSKRSQRSCISERHKVDPRVMKEGIDENHPWVTDDAIDKEGGQCVWHNKCFGYCIVENLGK